MEIDSLQLGYTLAGGLGLFIYGMKFLSEGLQSVMDGFTKKVVNSLTGNRLVAVAVGFIITVIVQSSTITTTLVIGYANAGLMSLAQSIGVILGANIGTTVIGWVLAMKAGPYALLLVAVGVVPMVFFRNQKINGWGKVLFSLGLIFFGLTTMNRAFHILSEVPLFSHTISLISVVDYKSLFLSIGLGCVLTFLINSSSIMLGLTMAMATGGVISFSTAMALVLGENLGTTISAIRESRGSSVKAKRAALSHTVFNLTGILIVSTIFFNYVEWIDMIIPSSAGYLNDLGFQPNIAIHIAAGHTIFNLLNVILFLPLLGVLEKIATKLIPSANTKEAQHLQLFGGAGRLAPGLAIEQAVQEIKKLAAMVQSILNLTKSYLCEEEQGEDPSLLVLKYEKITDNVQKEVLIFMEKVIESPLTTVQATSVKKLLRMADELESIADSCEIITILTKRLKDEGGEWDKPTKKSLAELFSICVRIYDSIFSLITENTNSDEVDLGKCLEDFNATAEALRKSALDRVGQNKMSVVFNLGLGDIIVATRRIKSHSINVRDAYLGKKRSWV